MPLTISQRLEQVEKSNRTLFKAVIDINAKIDDLNVRYNTIESLHEEKDSDRSDILKLIREMRKRIELLTEQIGEYYSTEPKEEEPKEEPKVETQSQLKCKYIAGFVKRYSELRGCDPLLISQFVIPISEKLVWYFSEYCLSEEEKFYDFTKIMDTILTYNVSTKAEIENIIGAIITWKANEDMTIAFDEWVVKGTEDVENGLVYNVYRLVSYDS